MYKGAHPLHLFEAAANTSSRAFSLVGLGIALVAVLWAYEGWHVVSFVAGEMKSPQPDLPRSLFCGTAIVMLIYLVANLGYYHVLTAAEIRGSDALAVFVVGKLLGPAAAAIISLLILVSIVGCMNGLVLTGPRVYYAMARDSAFPRIFDQINDRCRTPILALIVQGVWASALAVSGSYQQIFTDVIFTAWIFYGLAVAAVLVLRHTQPQLERPFRVLGYAWLEASEKASRHWPVGQIVKWIQDMPYQKCLHQSTRYLFKTREGLCMAIGNHIFLVLPGCLIAGVRPIAGVLMIALLAVSLCAQTTPPDQSADLKPNQSTTVTISGYVRDMACLMKFNEALKPTNDCALMCARAGSPLVIVTKKGAIYVPMSATIPDPSQRKKLMPLVGSYVKITGEMYQRSGIKAIVVEQIKKADDTAPSKSKE
jgi:hypothetical protein